MYHRTDVLVDHVKDGFQFFQYCVLLFKRSQFTLCLFQKQLVLILIPDNLDGAFILIVLSKIAEAPELVYGDLFFLLVGFFLISFLTHQVKMPYNVVGLIQSVLLSCL